MASLASLVVTGVAAAGKRMHEKHEKYKDKKPAIAQAQQPLASLVVTGVAAAGKLVHEKHEKHKDKKAANAQTQQQHDVQVPATESELQLSLREAMWENELKTSMEHSEAKVGKSGVESSRPISGAKSEKRQSPAYQDVVGSRRAPEVVKGEDRFAGFAGVSGNRTWNCRANTTRGSGDGHVAQDTNRGLGLSGLS